MVPVRRKGEDVERECGSDAVEGDEESDGVDVLVERRRGDGVDCGCNCGLRDEDRVDEKVVGLDEKVTARRAHARENDGRVFILSYGSPLGL